MTALSVNVNKVALLRNARGGGRPDVVKLARGCLAAGAHGITVHPRPDGRHIRATDVLSLAAAIDPEVELNVEGNPFEGPRDGYPGFMQIVRSARPAQATLVPDAPGQLTSDHGWDVGRDSPHLVPVIEELHELGCRVSLFMDPDPAEVRKLAGVGADRIELYTEGYAVAHAAGAMDESLARYRVAAEAAQEMGLGVNAGHDLDLANLRDFLEAVPNVLEVSIGHALFADAIEYGLVDTVRRYLACIPGSE